MILPLIVSTSRPSSRPRARRHELRDLSARVTAPSGLPEARIGALVGEAPARMAEDFGFTGPPGPTTP
jgi:hypothetical protein